MFRSKHRKHALQVQKFIVECPLLERVLKKQHYFLTSSDKTLFTIKACDAPLWVVRYKLVNEERSADCSCAALRRIRIVNCSHVYEKVATLRQECEIANLTRDVLWTAKRTSFQFTSYPWCFHPATRLTCSIHTPSARAKLTHGTHTNDDDDDDEDKDNNRQRIASRPVLGNPNVERVATSEWVVRLHLTGE